MRVRGALIAAAIGALATTATARSERDFSDVTPKAATSPPGLYICWGNNAVIIDARHRAYGDSACYSSHAAIEAKIKARMAEIAVGKVERGCVGRDLITCVASIALVDQVTTGINGGLDGQAAEHDINGDYVPRWVRFDVFPAYNPALPKAAQEADHFTLSLDEHDNVTKVEVDLETVPGAAKTAQDWDGTGVFELAEGIVGACVGDRMAFYKKYDAMSKGETLSHYDTDTSYGDTGRSDGELCSFAFRVHSGGGVDINYGTHYSEGFTVAANPAAL